MKTISTMTAALVAAGFAQTAVAADYSLQQTIQLSASTTEVWNRIGDFCDIDDWHPDIRGCAIKVIDGRLHRVLATAEGGEIQQQRIAEEPGLSYTYRITETEMPIENFIATFSIEPLDGSSVTWSARFSSEDPAMEAAMAQHLEAGLTAIEQSFESQ